MKKKKLIAKPFDCDEERDVFDVVKDLKQALDEYASNLDNWNYSTDDSRAEKGRTLAKSEIKCKEFIDDLTRGFFTEDERLKMMKL
jgi:hypothetical protein